MSRGGRGGRGRGRGRGGLPGLGGTTSMGLTYADIQNLSREESALYPPLEPLPALTEYGPEEKRICELQLGFSARLRTSQYYVVENTKSDELPRYSDKYRPSPAAQPTLKRSELHAPFFPPEIFEAHFRGARKRRKLASGKDKGKRKVNLDAIENGSEQEKSPSSEDGGSQAGGESDYDVDEEYDNDYAENYFDNGEGDDFDDIGGDDGGGDFE